MSESDTRLPLRTLAEAREHLQRLCDEVIALQDVNAVNAPERWDGVRDQLVMAALYELPQVLEALGA